MALDWTAGPLPLRVLYRGTDDPPPGRLPLRAGPLSLAFEAGDLRSIRLGDVEVLRRVCVAVRDRNWDTVPATLSDLRVERGPDSFAITFRAEHRQGPVNFAWAGTIRGDASGTVTYAMDGDARATFLRNRIGLCVHHPIRECAGAPCVVEHADGSVERGAFPREISPHQPYKAIRAIAHEVAPGVRAEVRLDGEVFEMEDHRNWTDASFKTYSTPLDLPFPVEVPAGTTISQTFRLTLAGEVPAPRVATGGPDADALADTIAIGRGPGVPLPPIGLGVASHGRPLDEEEVRRLRALNLSHLRLDLRLDRADFPEVLRRATADATAVGVPLEVALFVSDAAAGELDALRATLDAIRPAVRVRHWLVFHVAEKSTGGSWVRLARDILKRHDPSALVGAGTDAYFTELNRGRPPVDCLDLVGYSISPQVHAFDDISIVENLGAQAATVENARRIAGGLPVVVGPVTLRPRFNPNATADEPEPAPGELPPQVDVRQMSLLGAGWTLGSIKALSLGRASGLTYYETTGWRGVLESKCGSPTPGIFRSLPSAVFPLYHVLADVGEFAGGAAVPADPGDPLRLEALALRRGGRTRVLVTNLGQEPRRARVVGLDPSLRWTIRPLDETNAVDAMRSPEAFRAHPGDSLRPTPEETLEFDLLPYAVARIDAGEDD